MKIRSKISNAKTFFLVLILQKFSGSSAPGPPIFFPGRKNIFSQFGILLKNTGQTTDLGKVPNAVMGESSILEFL